MIGDGAGVEACGVVVGIEVGLLVGAREGSGVGMLVVTVGTIFEMVGLGEPVGEVVDVGKTVGEGDDVGEGVITSCAYTAPTKLLTG